MDSGNSGSLQSSSGGDDEFDSRCGADSSPLSALLRQPPPPSVQGYGGGSLIYGLQELRTPPLSHWCSTTAPLPAGAETSSPLLPSHGAPMAASAAADQADAAPAQAPPRGSRKRARASRRAPTTVLTTDTSNFRAMVQEFTGIPAPPFAGGATTTVRSRFDHLLCFPSRTTTAAAGTASPATLPQYLLRPFGQKVRVSSASTPYPPSFTSPSTSSPAPANISIAPASTTTTTGTTSGLAASSDTYHQLTAAASTTSALLGMQQDHSSSSSSNYHSFHQQSSSLGGDAKYAAHRAFDRGVAPPSFATRLQDPADFLGLTHDVMVGSQEAPHANLHPRNGGDELSGLVGGASVTGAGGCKATYSSTRPLLERNRRNPSAAGGGSTATTAAAPVAATAVMRTQAGVVDSWVCTSD